jgi:hypothetical protein
MMKLGWQRDVHEAPGMNHAAMSFKQSAQDLCRLIHDVEA